MKTRYLAKDGKLFTSEHQAQEHEDKLFSIWWNKPGMINLELLLQCESTEWHSSQADTREILMSYLRNYWEQHVVIQ